MKYLLLFFISYSAFGVCSHPINITDRKEIVSGADISSVPVCSVNCNCADDLVTLAAAKTALRDQISKYKAGNATAASVVPLLIDFIKAQQGL